MQLPPALIPWSSWLDLFDEPLAPGLGEMIRHLDLAVGNIHKKTNADQGEPDGYNGITHKGSYERLLLSEWLLADVWPNEFLRRAASGEHLFLKPAFEDKGASLRSVVLFDAGPQQLGTPRLVHLAMMIVLARRASHAGASFEWGIAQRPKDGLTPNVDPEDMTMLLASHNFLDAQPTHWDAWKTSFGENKPEDLWLVGTGRYPELSPRGVTIEDDIASSERDLKVNVYKPGGHSEFALDLPDNHTCTRLFRNPFSKDTVNTDLNELDINAAAGMVLHHMGNKLAVLLGNGTGAILNLPNSPHSKPGNTKIYRPEQDHRLIGVMFTGKRYIPITLHMKSIILHRYKNPTDAERDALRITNLELGLYVGQSILHPFFLTNGSEQLYHFHPKSERLFTYSKGALKVKYEKVLAAELIGDTLVVSKLDMNRTLTIQEDGKEWFELELDQGTGTTYFSGKMHKLTGITVHTAPDLWIIRTLDEDGELKESSIHLMESEMVMGLLEIDKFPRDDRSQRPFLKGAYLVALDQSRTKPFLQSVSGSHALPGTALPIVNLKVHRHSSTIVYMGEDGELIVFSLKYWKTIHHLLPGALR